MSEQPRKVNNPLLTAACQGFPFEGYSSNPLLMPVTPAVDALPEESTLVNEPITGSTPRQGTSAGIDFSSTVEDRFSTVPQPNEQHRKESNDQPMKQSYFTSILSSLPNLSLSSITGDTSPSQTSNTLQQQFEPTNPNVSRDPSFQGLSQNVYGAPPTSGTFVAKDQTRDPLGPNPKGPGDIGFSGPPPGTLRPVPAVPALPPSGGPGSYRLGNQRRLKYAPPPDLTSNAPKQYQTPGNFFNPLQLTTPESASDFLIPNATPPLTSSQSSSDSASGRNLQSGNIGLHGSQSIPSGFPATSGSTTQQTSFHQPLTNRSNLEQTRPAPSHCDPGSTNRTGSTELPSSSPREIPSRFPETATPQNTPANASFTAYASSYELNRAQNLINPDRVEPRISGTSAGTTNFSQGLTFDVPISAYPRSNVLPNYVPVIEPNVVASTNESRVTSGLAEDSSFTPISAAKVTAKLEHLLAEREEDSSSITSKPEPPSTFSEVSKAAEQEKLRSSFRSVEFERSVEESEEIEDLAEIDLTRKASLPDTSLTQTNIAGPQVLYGVDSSKGDNFTRTGSHSSTPSGIDVSSKSSSVHDSFSQNPVQTTLPTVTSFFATGSETRKPEINYFSTATENPEAFYNFPSSSQSQQTASSFFGSESQTSASNSSTYQFPNAAPNCQAIPPANPPQSVPTFYDPGQFPATNRDPIPSSVFPSQIPPTGDFSSQNPFSSVLSSSPPIFPTAGSFMATAMPEPTGSATLNPVQISVSSGIGRSNSDMIPPSLQSLAAGPSNRRMQYRPVYHHWFYRKEVENKVIWSPFSMHDSLSLEEVHNSSEITPETVVATDGGRYDVDILRRLRNPVYWTGGSTEVRRSSWFYKGSTESRYIPYDESTAARLEEEYKQACLTDNWNRRVELNNGEYIVFHSSTVQVHHMPATSPELAGSWGNTADSETGTYLQGAASRPKVVKRGVDEFHIDEGEPEKVDHLLFLVHGIGSVCDLKFRTVEEVVDEFRSISLQLVQSHYRSANVHGIVNRIEVLPISWHTTLHSEDTGIDKKLRAITLQSIPKLRHFTNDTLLDILFYTSPIYCQTIMETVGNEMNRLYSLFKERNQNFDGSVYLGGHSLGSLILFDLLCHQKPPAEESKDETDPMPTNSDNKSEENATEPVKSMPGPVPKRRLSKKVSYVMGTAGTGQPFINYPQLSFLPRAFFALGSPIGMFVTVRGIDTLGEDFVLPTCPAFFNVFHPFDPVAYRVESLVNPDAQKFRPMLIPHHKGRKRMHLELKETMARVGADLKQKLLDSVRSTWNSVYHLAMFHRPDNQSFEQEIEKVVEEQLQKSPSVDEQQNDDDGGADFRVGKLNGGRRIDYVLQEAPFEYINEYIFALTSHVCYWESEDTMLMILKEIYGGNGIQSDAQLPQQTMTIERAAPSPSIATISGVSTPQRNSSGATSPVGFDPTAPIVHRPVGPPPTSGFVRKS